MSDATMEKFKSVFSNAVVFSSTMLNGELTASGDVSAVRDIAENYDPQLSMI